MVRRSAGCVLYRSHTSLPLHLKETNWRVFDCDYTLDTFVRYGYLLWLLWYFFISNLNLQNDLPEPKKWDVWYDVLQPVCSLTAAFFLGFVLPDQRYGLSAYAFVEGPEDRRTSERPQCDASCQLQEAAMGSRWQRRPNGAG